MSVAYKSLSIAILLVVLGRANPALAESPQRNVVLFVADGLRHGIVTEQNAPTMYRLMNEGVAFANSHAIFPTFTTANASSLATGHYLGDTGDFSNTIYSGATSLPSAKGSTTPFLESDPILGDMDSRFNGNYLNEESILALARNAGFSTATIGKLGPTLIMDHTDRGRASIVLDDSTGKPAGVPLLPALVDALKAAGLPLEAPVRGANGVSGTGTRPGTLSANVYQQAYFVAATTAAVLPLFKQGGKPFLLVFWSRDPDGAQHNQGDSLLKLAPGINGPTSLAAVRNADNNLSAIWSALKPLSLDQTTDLIVASDHGFSTISKQSDTSVAARGSYADVPASLLPPGFLAIDIAAALQMPLYDLEQNSSPVLEGSHPSAGNASIGPDSSKPNVVVAANGGSDLIYLPGDDRSAIARRVVDALLAEDYVSGLFVDDRLGSFAGTLPLSAVNLAGSAVTPVPAIVVNFRSFHVSSDACPSWLTCTAEVADTTLQQGQGMHGTFSRADTFNFMAAIGPSFKRGYVDHLPASNADLGQTIARLLALPIGAKQNGRLVGRVLDEAFTGGTEALATRGQLSSEASNGLRTIVQYQQVGNTRYFSAAGFAGKTVGIDPAGRADKLEDAVERLH